MTSIKELTLIFENCDSITIPGIYIGDIFADEIKTKIQRMACNHVDKMEICNSFFVEIHPDANVQHNEFGVEEEWCKATVFNRIIRCDDITGIEIVLYDKDEEETYEYYTNWCGVSEYKNIAQKSYISKAGWLYILIDENKELSDVLFKEVDDEEYMELKARRFKLGNLKTGKLEKREEKGA